MTCEGSRLEVKPTDLASVPNLVFFSLLVHVERSGAPSAAKQ